MLLRKKVKKNNLKRKKINQGLEIDQKVKNIKLNQKKDIKKIENLKIGEIEIRKKIEKKKIKKNLKNEDIVGVEVKKNKKINHLNLEIKIIKWKKIMIRKKI